MRQCTEAQFLKDVSGHQMRVIRDDGKHRHVRFEKPGSSCMHFELITWPGYLAYVGDMGSYVFSRLPDMFQFFRMGDGDLNHNERGLSINPSYWAGKIEAADRYNWRCCLRSCHIRKKGMGRRNIVGSR